MRELGRLSAPEGRYLQPLCQAEEGWLMPINMHEVSMGYVHCLQNTRAVVCVPAFPGVGEAQVKEN